MCASLVENEKAQVRLLKIAPSEPEFSACEIALTFSTFSRVMIVHANAYMHAYTYVCMVLMCLLSELTIIVCCILIHIMGMYVQCIWLVLGTHDRK